MSALINKDGPRLPVDRMRSAVNKDAPFHSASFKAPYLTNQSTPSAVDTNHLQKAVIYTTEIVVPAYTVSGEGLALSFQLEAHPQNSSCHLLEVQGLTAEALSKNFLRTLSILTFVNPSWKRLLNFQFQLISSSNHYFVKDTRSAGLPLAIALLNILRLSNGLNVVDNVVGTGVLRIDGSFDIASGKTQKRTAVKAMYPGKMFLDAVNCPHVLDLYTHFQHY